MVAAMGLRVLALWALTTHLNVLWMQFPAHVPMQTSPGLNWDDYDLFIYEYAGIATPIKGCFISGEGDAGVAGGDWVALFGSTWPTLLAHEVGGG